MITLKAEAEQHIREEGEKAYPNECCGFLLGAAGVNGGRVVKKTISVENNFEDGERYHRFKIEPEDFMRAEKEARREGVEVLGFYHSHPDHPARPSDYDREQALPFYSYVIVAVEKGKAAELTSWELTADREQFNEEDITIWQ